MGYSRIIRMIKRLVRMLDYTKQQLTHNFKDSFEWQGNSFEWQPKNTYEWYDNTWLIRMTKNSFEWLAQYEGKTYDNTGNSFGCLKNPFEWYKIHSNDWNLIKNKTHTNRDHILNKNLSSLHHSERKLERIISIDIETT